MSTTSSIDRTRVAETTAFVTVGLVSIVFWRGVQESFDLVKATILWSGGLLILGMTLFDFRRISRRIPRPVLAASAVFVGALLVSALIISDFRWTSFWGQYQRYTGLLTWLILISIMLSVASRSKARRPVSDLYFTGLLLVSTSYVILQYSGNDPFRWTTTSFGNPIFGTIGNPNTAAGLAVMLCPFAFVVALDSQRAKVTRFVCGYIFFMSLVSIEILDSFQANVAALLLLIFALHLLRRMETVDRRNLASIPVLAVAILVLPNLDGYVWPKVISAAALALIVVYLLPAVSDSPTNFGSRIGNWVAIGLPVLALSTLLVASVRNFVRLGFQGGFVERGDFYRSGYEIFKTNPVFGRGLETFGYYFAQYRPESHAINLEDNRSSSAHNVFLGMFDSGGLILGLAYLFLISVFAWLVIQKLRSRTPLSLHQMGLLTSFLIFQVISLVTVEHIVLFTVSMLVNGLLIREFKGEVAVQSVRHKRRQTSEGTMPLWSVPALLLGVLLLSAVTVWRPIQAARASVAGITATSIGQRLEENQRATELAPWEGLYWAYRAEVELALEMNEDAITSIQKGMERLNFSPSFVTDGARVLAELGRFDLSLQAISKSIANDPYAPVATGRLIELLDAIEEAAVQANDVAVLDQIRSVRDGLPSHLAG